MGVQLGSKRGRAVFPESATTAASGTSQLTAAVAGAGNVWWHVRAGRQAVALAPGSALGPGVLVQPDHRAYEQQRSTITNAKITCLRPALLTLTLIDAGGPRPGADTSQGLPSRATCVEVSAAFAGERSHALTPTRGPPGRGTSRPATAPTPHSGSPQPPTPGRQAVEPNFRCPSKRDESWSSTKAVGPNPVPSSRRSELRGRRGHRAGG
jgi:hypothetical protein